VRKQERVSDGRQATHNFIVGVGEFRKTCHSRNVEVNEIC
jgi:hypothetical protein